MIKVNISGRSPTMAELASAENPQPNRALASAFDASKNILRAGTVLLRATACRR